MAYVQHSNWRDRPGAVVAVVAIHAAVGYALVTGLSFTKLVEVVRNPRAVDVVVPIEPLPPPPKPQPSATPTNAVVTPPVHAPTPPLDLDAQRPQVDTSPIIQPTPDVAFRPLPGPTPAPGTTPAPAFDPVPARPRGNPSLWVTESDYRTPWINREITGTARFRLAISATGKVEGCTITASSGHPELDAATCDLVSRRARFDPAKDGSGAATGGSYTSSVRWVLPD